MAASTGGGHVDLYPWSAYVLGLHPYILATWHAESWDMMRATNKIPDRGYRYGSPRELWELDEALWIMARHERVDAAVLDRLRRYVARFVEVSKDIYDNAKYVTGSEDLDWEKEYAPCEIELSFMMENSSKLITAPGKLITAPEGLLLWELCGAAIGETMELECPVSAWRWDSPQDRFHALTGAFQMLMRTGDYPYLDKLADRLPEFDPQAPWLQAGVPPHVQFEARKRRQAELDEELRRALREQAPPEVWLDLDKDRLIFFGARYYLDRVPAGEKVQDYLDRLTKAEAAFLWVLADRAGEEVSREVICNEEVISRVPEELDYEATLLRNKLKPAIDAFFVKRGGDRPEFAKKCFIEGIRVKGPLSGPYILRLDPSRVRVSGPRPDWM